MKDFTELSSEIREYVERMMEEHRAEYRSNLKTLESANEKINNILQIIQIWMRQTDPGAYRRDGARMTDVQRIKDLERENIRLYKLNEMYALANDCLADEIRARSMKS